MKRMDGKASIFAKPFPNQRLTQGKSSFLLQKLLSNPHIPRQSIDPQQSNDHLPQLSLYRIQPSLIQQ